MSGEDRTAALLDRATLERLASEVGDEFGAIIDTFKAEMRERIGRMRSDALERAAARLAHEAHAVKGTASAIGFARLAAKAAALELQAQADDGAGAVALVDEIAAIFARSVAALDGSGMPRG